MGAVLGFRRAFEVAIDDSGARPAAILTVAGAPDAALEGKLKEAFKTYEFAATLGFAER